MQKIKTISTEFETFRNTNAQPKARLALSLKPRIPELFSDSNSGHIQVVNQKNNLLRRGEKALYNKSLEGISEPF
jgi:hypothetical protein